MINAKNVGNTAIKHMRHPTSICAIGVIGRAKYYRKFRTYTMRNLMRPEQQNPGGKFMCSPGILQTPILPSFAPDKKRFQNIKQQLSGMKQQ